MTGHAQRHGPKRRMYCEAPSSSWATPGVCNSTAGTSPDKPIRPMHVGFWMRRDAKRVTARKKKRS